MVRTGIPLHVNASVREIESSKQKRFLMVKKMWHGKTSSTAYCHGLYSEHPCI